MILPTKKYTYIYIYIYKVVTMLELLDQYWNLQRYDQEI